MGSKASEMEAVKDVLRNEYYTDAFYLFNFISEKEQADLLEFMMDRARQTFFMEYAPDQFEYVPNESFDQMLPVEDLSQPEEPKKRGSGCSEDRVAILPPKRNRKAGAKFST